MTAHLTHSAAVRRLGTLLDVVRAELIRLRRPGLLLGWSGLVAVLCVLVNSVMFGIAQEQTPPTQGPGVSFPSLTELLEPGGLVAGLGSASSMLGVVTLSFWALATASDHTTGLIRLLVAAHPRRGRLVLGKWLALAAATAAVVLLAVVVNVVVAPIAAGAAGLEPTAWGDDVLSTVVVAIRDLYLTLLVWGTIGLAIATLTRSAGIAIGVGVGWVLLIEQVIGAASQSVAEWLPGAVMTALARGGTPDTSYAVALSTAAAYTLVAIAVAIVMFRRRDVTD
ncbi:hypothetical protein GCM10027425_10660 [Alteromonas gracilis]